MANKSAPKNKSRFQFDFQPRTVQRLLRLKEKTEAASYAEVVRRALAVYEADIEDEENGNGKHTPKLL